MSKLVITLSLFLYLIPFSSVSQTWQQMMQDPTVNFFDVKREFYKYLEKKERKIKRQVKRGQAHEEEIPGYAMFKRWEWFMEQRVYPSGDRIPLIQSAYENYLLNANTKINPSLQQSGSWSLLGPVNTIPNGGGCGRLNCIRIDPVAPNTLYVGAPAGGMWVSTNGGLSWSTTTDNLASIGVSDVVADYTNPNIIYIGTGDNDAGDTYSIGVLKSIDGGLTWNATGLTFLTTQSTRVTKMLIHPTVPTTLYAATNVGVYKTTDAGLTWFKVFGQSSKDLEFKPGDPNSIYVTTTNSFYKSSNAGVNFYLVTNGLPGGSSVSRMSIAVTAADPNYVYVVTSKNSNQGFQGVYLSTNSGNSFVTQSTSPNLLGWDANGGDTDGQGWYTLSIAASPTDKNELIVGGVNIWRSTDGGQNWLLNAHWYGGGGAPYVHADIHDLYYKDGNSFYVASDGGLFYTTNSGNTFTDLSAGLQIAQMYRLGTSATNPNLTITGWQDNGTNLWTAGSWAEVYGGDGMECFINYSNPLIMYAESQNGGLGRSLNGGANWTGIGGFTTESAQWITPWCIDPVVPTTIYAGFGNVWKSTNQGNSWNPISNFGNIGLTIVQVAPSNNQIIFAGSSSILYKTTNGGSTWSTVPLPFTAFLNSVAIDAANPNNLWVCFGGFFAPNKVYKSTDGGATWTNITTSNLPNVHCNTIVSQAGTNGGVYVGTDIGVFYYDENIQNWAYFSNGLPNVIVDELEIQVSSGKLRAATYGRGLWESSLYNPASTAPIANFIGSVLSGCPGLTVQFTDLSSNAPTGWNWSFPGGTPSSSTAQNPIITYNNPASFNNVKLVASNGNGSDSMMRYSYIMISALQTPTISLTNNDTVCDNEPLQLIASSGASYLWSSLQSTYLINPVATGVYSVTVTDIYGCSATSAPVNITILPFPTVSITQNQDTFCANSSATNYQWYLNGSPINGATSQCYTVAAPGNYYVVVTDSNGCTGLSNTLVGFSEFESDLFPVRINPNPVNNAFILTGYLPFGSPIWIEIFDLFGKKLRRTYHGNISGQFSIPVDVSEYSSGGYFISINTELGSVLKRLIISKK